MKTQPKNLKQNPTRNATQRRRLRNLIKQAKNTSKTVKISLDVPLRHYNVMKEVGNILQCTPETLFQKALNHALKGNTLGHVVESMIGEKYHDVFNNNHNLDLS
jgi:predicted metallo-beta-lactamase superfamily hydrolase